MSTGRADASAARDSTAAVAAVQAADSVAAQWRLLRGMTRARVGLGHTGVSLPTSHLLAFEADHALARDAVREPFDADNFAARVSALDLTAVTVTTLADDREQYLRRPDLGRRLSTGSREQLRAMALSQRGRFDSGWDVVFIVSDGLSATATTRHAIRLLAATLPLLESYALSVGPVVIAPFARVGLLNDVGPTLGARAAAILLGERPGLSAPDSLSAYYEFQPRPELTDADRNCISNIRDDGLTPERAADALATLIREGARSRLSGTRLKLEYPADDRPLSSGSLGTGPDQRGRSDGDAVLRTRAGET